MFLKIEKLLAKLSGNKNPEYVDGNRVLLFREHVWYNAGILLVNLFLGTICVFLIHINKNIGFDIITILGFEIAIIKNTISFIAPFTILLFFKNFRRKWLSVINIYELFIIVSLVNSAITTYNMITTSQIL